MNMHDPNRTEPCRHMETLLQREADGSAKGLGKWYALSHAARCGACGRFLRALKGTIRHLRTARNSDVDSEAVARLSHAKWRESVAADESP